MSDFDAERRREHWHLSKSINIGHLLTTFAVVISVFTYVNSFDQRLTKNELDVEHIKETRQADIKRADERYSGIKDDLKDISRKLDRLIQGDKGD